MTKRPVMALGLALAVLLGVGAGACGSARSGSGSRPGSSSAASVSTVTRAGAEAGLGALLGDEDRDSPGRGYYDGDDLPIRSYGQAATAADRRAIAALVERYYAAAAAGDGARACELTHPLAQETLPEEYGQPPGPPYLHGANTCPSLLTRVFEHFHSQLTVPIEVTDARVSGDRAYALVGFRTLPAGFVKARRAGGVWRVDGLLADPLP
jgi:hypothetical protein